MTAQEYIFDTPLYNRIKLDQESFYLELLGDKEYYDGYNPLKKKESTYQVIKGFCNYESGCFKRSIWEQSGIKSLILECKRYKDELYIYTYLDVKTNTIMKIGQYPSVADIHIGEIKQYKKVLSDEKLKEFTRAIGLAANGVGIGSFVYLRRIFESLIFDIAENAISAGSIEKEEFGKARMDEKIRMLKLELPTFLVENQSIYGILSAGIHELSEDECLGYFDVMRVSIEFILDERLEKIQKKDKEKKATKALSSITAKIQTPTKK